MSLHLQVTTAGELAYRRVGVLLQTIAKMGWPAVIYLLTEMTANHKNFNQPLNPNKCVPHLTSLRWIPEVTMDTPRPPDTRENVIEGMSDLKDITVLTNYSKNVLVLPILQKTYDYMSILLVAPLEEVHKIGSPWISTFFGFTSNSPLDSKVSGTK